MSATIYMKGNERRFQVIQSAEQVREMILTPGVVVMEPDVAYIADPFVEFVETGSGTSVWINAQEIAAIEGKAPACGTRYTGDRSQTEECPRD